MTVQLRLVGIEAPAEPENQTVSFDEFWKEYPRRVAKKDALKAWREIHPSLHAKIMDAISRAKTCREWKRCDREGNAGAFIPYPASWLRGERWEDELDVDLPPSAPAATSGAARSLEILGRKK